MIEIKKIQGGYAVDGKPFRPKGLVRYRQRQTVQAVRMTEPFSIESHWGQPFTGEVGDWLIVELNGVMLPCRGDVFHKLYEVA